MDKSDTRAQSVAILLFGIY